VLVNLRILAVRPVKAHLGADRMRAARIGVERVVVGPLVVGLPGVVAALEKEVGRAVIADDKDAIALPVRLHRTVWHGGEAGEINAAGPGGGHLERERWLPLAFAQAVLTDGWIRLFRAAQRAFGLHQPRAAHAVVAGPENLHDEPRVGAGADHEVESITGLYALARAVAFDGRRAGAAGLVEAHAGELPVEGAGLGVFLCDERAASGAGGIGLLLCVAVATDECCCTGGGRGLKEFATAEAGGVGFHAWNGEGLIRARGGIFTAAVPEE